MAIVGIIPTTDENNNTEERIKVIKNLNIGEYSWDSQSSTENFVGAGINNWSTSKMMKLLNPGYENESIGGSLFWNSASGNCYFGANLGNKQCSFNSMNDVSRSVFDDVLWYTGGINGWYGVNTFTAYERERTLNSYTYTSQELGISTRVETWVGKIGLPYMSDYGFASNVCYNQYNLWSSSSTDGYQLDICKNSNWLAIDRNYFTMNPKYDSDSVVMTVRTNGNTYEASTKDTFLHVYPTGFLNPDVEITGGVGSYEDPFTIA